MSEKITVGILRENDTLENRVSLVPKDVKLLIQVYNELLLHGRQIIFHK